MSGALFEWIRRDSWREGVSIRALSRNYGAHSLIIILRSATGETGCGGGSGTLGPLRITGGTSPATRSGLLRGPVLYVLACLADAICGLLARGATHTSKPGSYVPSTEMLDEST
jgi:hypothetical protein